MLTVDILAKYGFLDEQGHGLERCQDWINIVHEFNRLAAAARSKENDFGVIQRDGKTFSISEDALNYVLELERFKGIADDRMELKKKIALLETENDTLRAGLELSTKTTEALQCVTQTTELALKDEITSLRLKISNLEASRTLLKRCLEMALESKGF